MLSGCIHAECESCFNHFKRRGDQPSSLFQEGLIGSDGGVPAGVFIRAVGVFLQKCLSESCPPTNCLNILTGCQFEVIRFLSHDSPEPRHFEDPRCTICEAWFLSMATLADIPLLDSAERETLLIESTLLAVSLLFKPDIIKSETRQTYPCMSLDGPQGLALLSFLVSFIRNSGCDVFRRTACRIRESFPVHPSSANNNNDELIGISILVSSLYRAFQGSLPPWAIEQSPDLFSALYSTPLQSKVDLFGAVLLLGMELRSGNTTSTQLLSGPYFSPLQQDTREQFVRDMQNLARQGTATLTWRRVKVLIKRICGGKKKNTDFQQKPAYTRWNFTKI